VPERPCRLRTLSDEPGCRIDACEHGLLHVTLGAVTLRLAPAEAARLRRGLGAATSRLDRPPSERALH